MLTDDEKAMIDTVVEAILGNNRSGVPVKTPQTKPEPKKQPAPGSDEETIQNIIKAIG